MKRTIDRRTMLQAGCAAVATAGPSSGLWRALGTAHGGRSLGSAGAANPGGPPLREKFLGCVAGVYVGSAMGAPVEGWSWERIEKEHGTLDRFLPYHHYRATTDWVRPPGTTEDGVERQKLMILAILAKKDRVTAEDVRRSWLENMNPGAPGVISEPFEGALLEMARSPMPAADIGKYCDYSGLVSLSRSCHPIGLINAGDVPSAIADVHEVGQLYNVAGSRGIRWAEVTVAAIAAATRPGATVDSVLGAVFDHCDRSPTPWRKEAGVRPELERGLALSKDCRDLRDLRARMDTVYSGQGIPYASSFANEVVTKAICIFRMTGGDTWKAVVSGVNMGRDTDCVTAIAAGISGALSGPASIPADRLEQVDRATALNEHTCARKTLRETADLLYGAYSARLERLRTFVDAMSIA
jgi:ADP-ribosylglycohydrolase